MGEIILGRSICENCSAFALPFSILSISCSRLTTFFAVIFFLFMHIIQSLKCNFSHSQPLSIHHFTKSFLLFPGNRILERKWEKLQNSVYHHDNSLKQDRMGPNLIQLQKPSKGVVCSKKGQIWPGVTENNSQKKRNLIKEVVKKQFRKLLTPDHMTQSIHKDTETQKYNIRG